MATVREHLAKMHNGAATFHRAMARCHGDAMEKAQVAEEHSPWAAFHKSAAAAHSEAAGAHDAMCEECSKAQQAADLEKNQLEPSPISRVAPDRTTVTPVVRTGGKPFPMHSDAAQAAPIDFAKIVGLDDLNEL
jgi:hypothetical protein